MIGVSVARNLLAGVRLALFMRLRAFDFRASAADFAALTVFNFLFWIVIAGIRVGFVGEIDPFALFIYLATVPLVLATAMLVAMAYGAPQLLLPVAVALSAPDPVFQLASLALPYLIVAMGRGITLLLFFGWVWIVAIRAVVVCAGTRRPQLYQGAAAVSVLMAITLFAFPETDVWRAPEGDEEAAPLAEERLFHLQGELIERSLASIQPGRPGVREQYFVGFAPDASEIGRASCRERVSVAGGAVSSTK